MGPELQIQRCCGVGQFCKERVCGRDGWKLCSKWDDCGKLLFGTSILFLVRERLPWQMVFQCRVFLEHQEYRDTVCDFILQLVPFAFPPLVSPQPPVCGADVQVWPWSCYTTFMSGLELLAPGICNEEKFRLSCSLHIYVLMLCCHETTRVFAAVLKII